jgi:ankyrin repeat protein
VQCTSIGVFPVHRAAESGNLALVKFFVEECHVAVDVRDFSGTTPLHYATYNGHEAITRYLVEVARADYHVENNDKLTLVHNAAYVTCCGTSSHVAARQLASSADSMAI